MFETVTLPLTGDKAVTGYSVKIESYRDGLESYAYRGELIREDGDSQITAGYVRQDGLGVDSSVSFIDDAEQSLFKEYAQLWDFPWGEELGMAMAHDEESIITVLSYETLLAIEKSKANHPSNRRAKLNS